MGRKEPVVERRGQVHGGLGERDGQERDGQERDVRDDG